MKGDIVLLVGIFFICCFIGWIVPIYYIIVIGTFIVGCFIEMGFVFHKDDKDFEFELARDREQREILEKVGIEVIE